MRHTTGWIAGWIACSLVLAAAGAWTLGSGEQPKTKNLANLTAMAISTATDSANESIAQLRALGPAGLSALMTTYRADIDAHRLNPSGDADPQRWGRISAALDGVAKQRDAWACGLYWYTDLPAAQAAAWAAGKPILSLHLLGRLDQELSCTNSRFFRVTLYPNKAAQDAMRNGFVLHWQSERPVPTITIDFGDGRKIVRTITGNSIHYVLDANGRVIDAIPGLYGVQPFVERLKEAAAIELAVRNKSDNDRGQQLDAWHSQQIAATDTACQADLRALNLTAVPPADDLPRWQALGSLHSKQMQVDQGVNSVILAKHPQVLRRTFGEEQDDCRESAGSNRSQYRKHGGGRQHAQRVCAAPPDPRMARAGPGQGGTGRL